MSVTIVVDRLYVVRDLTHGLPLAGCIAGDEMPPSNIRGKPARQNVFCCRYAAPVALRHGSHAVERERNESGTREGMRAGGNAKRTGR